MSDLNTITNQLFDRREAMRPNARTWAKHLLLLLITFVTVTIAGVLQPFGIIEVFPKDEPQSWNEIFQFVLSLPLRYVGLISETIQQLYEKPHVLQYGLKLSISLLIILICHEMGHYIACRIYGVDATLPYFIPTPPMIGPAGTFGAFIKIVSPMPSRRAVFDIGVAGPIAGFIALIPIALIAFFTYQYDAPAPEIPGGTLVFSDPLLFKLLAAIFGVDMQKPMIPNPFYFAAWIGLLVTALNLIPSGQLDGGHAMFAVFNKKIHFWTGRIAFVVVAITAISGWFLYSSPSGFLFAVLLGVMMRVKHPEPYDTTPLDFKRKVIAILTVLIFILSVTPFPIQIR
ncbi:MAG: site-2 protease family protein [Pyrinomonadaceae bacterium]